MIFLAEITEATV